MEYRKVKYDEKEIEITFKNDMIFKGLFSLYDSSEFLKFFINSITGRNFHSFELKRNEVSGENWDDKVFYFDIFAKDEEGRDVIIEMQNSIIGKIQTIRFQVYACRVISNKVYKGMDYSEVTSVDVIIITSERVRNQLYSKATLKFENGDEVEGNLYLSESTLYKSCIDWPLIYAGVNRSIFLVSVYSFMFFSFVSH